LIFIVSTVSASPKPRFQAAQMGPKCLDFLCFGTAPGDEKGAPRLKEKTISKGCQKRKKNAGKAGVFSL
jgi:hypothetical protein